MDFEKNSISGSFLEYLSIVTVICPTDFAGKSF